jgi:hypothetical protein
MIYFQKAKSNPNRLDKKKHVNSLVIFFFYCQRKNIISTMIINAKKNTCVIYSYGYIKNRHLQILVVYIHTRLTEKAKKIECKLFLHVYMHQRVSFNWLKHRDYA